MVFHYTKVVTAISQCTWAVARQYCTTLTPVFDFTLLGDLDTPISPPPTPSTPYPSSPQRPPLHCQALTPPTSAPFSPQCGAIAKSCQNSPVIENQLLPSWPLLKCIQTNLHSLKQEIEESKEKCKVLKDEALTAFEEGLNRIKSFLRVEHPKV